MNILITGVAGFIGSRFADYLINTYNNLNIIGVDSLFGGYIENVNEHVVFFKRDISKETLSDIFEKYSIDYVYHFAAYAAEGLSPFMRKYNYINNMGSTAEIINCCINYKVKRLIYISSNSVYGKGITEGQLFNEDDQPKPIDPYAISKYACELDIQVAGEQHGLDWCIIRPHNVFGEKQNIWDSYRNVIGIWMLNSLENKPITIYGDGKQTRAFTYIDNILEPLYNAMGKSSASKQIINLGGIECHSLNELAILVSNITGNPNIQHKEARYEVKNAIPSHEKSINILNYKEHISVEKGIQNMWSWVIKQPKRDRQIWEKYEIDSQLYTYWKNN